MNSLFVKKLVCLVLVGVMAMFASGCEEKEAAKQKRYQTFFELPSGWERNPDQLSAILRKPQTAGNGHFVKIEGFGLYEGTSEDAKKEALKEISWDSDGKMQEEIINNKKIYILQGETDGEYMGAVTSFYFETGGWVFAVTLFDAYEPHKEAVRMFVDTLYFVEVK